MDGPSGEGWGKEGPAEASKAESRVEMFIHVLGTAAGGGFPQWNCACGRCAGVRAGTLRTRRRTQSSAAVSADGERWFLLNASPDVRVQMEAFPPLGPPGGRTRGSALEGILLSNADLDHTLGLFMLREGPVLPIHASASTRRALEEGLQLTRVLECYAGADWREPSVRFEPLVDRVRKPSGLAYSFIPLVGKTPRYEGLPCRMAAGESVAMRIRDERTGGELVYAPAVATPDDLLLSEFREAEVLLLDGTFFREEEMNLAGVGGPGAWEMGHLTVGGETGSLVRIRTLPVPNKVYVHINNTNPMLDEGSPEHAQVMEAGAQVGWDGMNFSI